MEAYDFCPFDRRSKRSEAFYLQQRYYDEKLKNEESEKKDGRGVDAKDLLVDSSQQKPQEKKLKWGTDFWL